MTETAPHYEITLPPGGPLQCIAQIQKETAELQAQRDHLQKLLTQLDDRIKQNKAEQLMHARVILDGKAPHEAIDLVLNPCCKWGTERTKPDVKKMRALCPDLLEKLGKVNDATAMRILETAHDGDKGFVQRQLRTIDPKTYWSKVQVNLTDLTKEEEAFCIDNGIITVTKKIIGEPTVMPRAFASALKSQKKPKTLKAAEDDDET
ncbi:MAG TPA: hypothetical protein O0X39_01205 [Methanocorpusculum sp.]|nr:hypothetical protein [Methanocorpusculum sp.]